jgi:hypothetical protein
MSHNPMFGKYLRRRHVGTKSDCLDSVLLVLQFQIEI